MHLEIINTGRELMLGWRQNSHAQWLCRQLSNRGYIVARQVTIDDSARAIEEAVSEALDRADLLLTTGGLGPTSDDRTRELIAGLLGRPLLLDPTVAAHIEAFFAARQRSFPDRVRVQAQVPEGSQVLLNAHGTAPGLAMEVPTSWTGAPESQRHRQPWLVMLPGPPRELKPMFLNQVLPLIQSLFPLPAPVSSRILRSTGLGESMVEEKLARRLSGLAEIGLEVGYCARPGEVDIQLVARGGQAEQIVIDAERIVREELGELIFGTGEESLEEVVIGLLRARGQRLAVAESCTGGFVTHRLTNVPGASEVLVCGLVTYSNAAKETCLGVQAVTLREHGAVSPQTASEMARNVRATAGADYGLALTGIAGPGGGSPDKPVGTVHIGLATTQGVEVRPFLNPFDRETFKYVTSQQALEWLRRELLNPRVAD